MHKKKVSFTNSQTIVFIVILSAICAFVLSILASSLKDPKDEAKVVDRSKQLLIAARIFDHTGNFLIEESGKFKPAVYDKTTKQLVVASTPQPASNADVVDIVESRVRPMLVDKSGSLITPEAAHISFNHYLNEHKKIGFSGSDYFPVYEVYLTPFEKGGNQKPCCYVIPVSGFGLWDYIFGFIAIKPDGKTVQGISWYDQKETPGLGAIIAEADWQAQFQGKLIFIPSNDGEVDFDKAPIGINVVRGKVKEVIGDAPKSRASVDGIAGATLTGNAVTRTYKETLELYRPFFKKLAKGEEGK